MAPKRQQLNSSSLEDASPISEALSQKKSPQKTKKPGSSVIKWIWSEEDELTVLNGLLDYRVETCLQPNSDWDAFCRFLGDSIVSKSSKEQLLPKIGKLKKNFLQGNNPESQADEYSNLIWGHNESQFATYAINKQKDHGEDTTIGEDEQVADAELLKENVAEKSNFDDKSTEKENTGEESNDNEVAADAELLKENVAEKSDFDDKSTKKETNGEESNDDNEVVADELCSVRDAFETLVSQDLSSNQKKMQLEKLMKIENEKRKEISEEWKEVCTEKAKLRLRKLRLSVRLAEAVNDN